jgi:hypothetical protein
VTEPALRRLVRAATEEPLPETLTRGRTGQLSGSLAAMADKLVERAVTLAGMDPNVA